MSGQALAIEQTGAYARAVATLFNTEFDSRVTRVSIGPAGMLRPRIVDINGAIGVAPGTPKRMLDILRRTDYGTPTYCANCGKPYGAVNDIPMSFRNQPGVFVICLDCDGKFGTVPAHAISFSDRKQ
jgi:hypothetical protein